MNINKDLYFKNLRGFKITGSHFELGSNLHIGDYYYVKRLFYNSFYTNRFAFLITRYILNEFRQTIDSAIAGEPKSPEGTITLMSFESYAELLVSNVRKMLNDYLAATGQSTREVFNHDIYTKNSLFLKNPNKVGSKIIAIFPISTTFSTSVKLQTEVLEQLHRICDYPIRFLNPVINCVIIPNTDLGKDHNFTGLLPESTFGWENHNAARRLIHVRSQDYNRQFPNATENLKLMLNEEVIQHYLIYMPTDWRTILECKKCYPADPAQEIALIETKLNPVTPNLIFSYPKTIAYAPNPDFFDFFDIKGDKTDPIPLVYRRHFVKNDNYYIYYIRVGRFLQENKERITNWLYGLNAELFTKGSDTDIVIITPTVGSNSGFPNLLNDLVFSDTATIIQFNPSEDYLQNFKIFYSDIIHKAGIVLFVNDVLGTTETISEINYYIKSVRRDQAGFDACICLINRAGYYDFVSLQRKLEQHKPAFINPGKSIVTFADVDVFSIDQREKNSYNALTEKFLELSVKSVLDNMRLHFKNKALQFQPVDLTKEYRDQKKAGSPKALFQFLLTHEFMKFFAVETGSERYLHQSTIDQVFGNYDPDARRGSFELLADMLMLTDAGSSIPPFLKKYQEFTGEVKYGLFKLCTSEPFVNYKNVRQTAFDWILNELIITVEQINKAKQVSAGFFQPAAIVKRKTQAYSAYQTFRFLLKRGAKLKMNFIYSIDTLKAIRVILTGMKRLHPNDFITYYVGLLQELIIDHEAKAVKVVMNVKRMIDSDAQKKTLKNNFEDQFIHLLRLLVLENTFIFHTANTKFLAKYTPVVKFGDDKADFYDIFEDFKESYAFQYAKIMLSRFDFVKNTVTEEPEIVKSFSYMLLLKTLLENDKKNDHQHQEVPMGKKVSEILKYACGILGIEDGGAFFAVNYKNKATPDLDDDVAIVGTYDQIQGYTLKPFNFTENSLLAKIFHGISEYPGQPPLSMFELAIDKSFSYHMRQNTAVSSEQLGELDEFKDAFFSNILFVRITDMHTKADSVLEIIPQGVLCFYKNKLSVEDTRSARAVLKSYTVAADQQTQIKFDSSDAAGNPALPSYERFDPKKVRQLLLLRNDLGQFIEHHLSNDSLRNYIEHINFENHSAMLRHSINTYESMLRTYIGKLQNNLGDRDAIKEQVDYLAIFFQYLVNKLHLLTLMQRLSVESALELPELSGSMTSSQIGLEFENLTTKILMMEQSDLICLEDPELLKLDVSRLKSAGNQAFSISPVIVKEIIFELIYNIKKHTLQNCEDKLSREAPLVITVAIKKEGGRAWLLVANNYCSKNETFIKKLEENMIKRRLSDGLSLIYHILFKLFNRKLKISRQDDLFTVQVPLPQNTEQHG